MNAEDQTELTRSSETLIEEGDERNDFFELGCASEETKGSWIGEFFDGGVGRFSF